MALFPSVPDLPGVPALVRAADFVFDVALLTADALGLLPPPQEEQWGLFLDGDAAIVAESVTAVGFKKSSQITDAPVEEGGFESYNKIQKPFQFRVRFSSGGSDAQRQALLDSVDAAQQSLQVFDAVTPEVTYESVNVVDYDYDRAYDRGKNRLVVNVLCQQVRQSTTTQFTSSSQAGATGSDAGTSSSPTTGVGGSTAQPFRASADFFNTRSPSAAAQVSDGVVQARSPTVIESSALPDITP